MEINQGNMNKYKKLKDIFLQKYERENIAMAKIISETLLKLNISIDQLPQKCRLLLEQATQQDILNHLDPLALSLYDSSDIALKLEEQYYILKLKQKNRELQARVDGNKKFLDDLRGELDCMKEDLNFRDSTLKDTLNPDNIDEHLRQTKQKVVSFEETYEREKTKFAKLHISESLYPKAISNLVSTLEMLKIEEGRLRQKAEDITFAREARQTLLRLKK